MSSFVEYGEELRKRLREAYCKANEEGWTKEEKEEAVIEEIEAWFFENDKKIAEDE